MTTADERLNDWLRDAHAMEEQAETMLKATAGRIENYPLLKSRIEQHIGETHAQAERLARCIERRGTSTSSVKDIAGKLMATVQGLSGIFVGDEVIKASMASYTFEHMEISSYRVLIAAAEEAGDALTAETCRANLREEEAMAEWLEENLDPVTRKYLAREETPGLTAKH